jgi:hypothetical protein
VQRRHESGQMVDRLNKVFFGILRAIKIFVEARPFTRLWNRITRLRRAMPPKLKYNYFKMDINMLNK